MAKEMSDQVLVSTWERKAADLADLKEEVRDLHQQVQARGLGPYAPDAQINAEEADDSGSPQVVTPDSLDASPDDEDDD